MTTRSKHYALVPDGRRQQAPSGYKSGPRGHCYVCKHDHLWREACKECGHDFGAKA